MLWTLLWQFADNAKLFKQQVLSSSNVPIRVVGKNIDCIEWIEATVNKIAVTHARKSHTIPSSP